MHLKPIRQKNSLVEMSRSEFQIKLDHYNHTVYVLTQSMNYDSNDRSKKQHNCNTRQYILEFESRPLHSIAYFDL